MTLMTTVSQKSILSYNVFYFKKTKKDIFNDAFSAVLNECNAQVFRQMGKTLITYNNFLYDLKNEIRKAINNGTKRN